MVEGMEARSSSCRSHAKGIEFDLVFVTHWSRSACPSRAGGDGVRQGTGLDLPPYLLEQGVRR